MWSGSLITNLADGVVITAAPLLAISLTKNPILISALSACIMLPWLLFAIPIGVIVDRFDRKYLIAAANGIRFLSAALIALLISTHTITIYLLIGMTFIIGISEVLVDTATQALIPQILESSQFEKGNSRLQISETVVQGFIGTPISGFLYAAAIYLPFVVNSAGYLISALLTISIPSIVKKSIKSTEQVSFSKQMKFGIKFLLNNRGLLRLVLTTASIGFCFSMATSTSVLFLIQDLHLQKSLFGVFLTVQGIGALVGGLVTPKISARFGRQKILTTAIVSNSILIFLQGLSPNIYIYALIGTIAAFCITHWNVLLMATYQDVIPADLYGRIHGTRRTIVWGLMPIGSLLGGLIAQFGLRVPFIVGGIFATIIAVASIPFIMQFGTAEAKKE